MNKFLNLINEQYIKLGDEYQVQKERHGLNQQKLQELKMLLQDFEQQQQLMDQKYQVYQENVQQCRDKEMIKKICYNPNQSSNYELKVQIMGQKLQKIQNKIKQNTVDIQQFHDKELQNQQNILNIQQQIQQIKQQNQVLDDQNKQYKLQIKDLQMINEQKQQDYDDQQKQQLQEIKINFDSQQKQIKDEMNQFKVKRINQQVQTEFKQENSNKQKQIEIIQQQQREINKKILLYEKKIAKYPICQLNPNYIKLKDIEQQEQIKEQYYNECYANYVQQLNQINNQLQQLKQYHIIDLQQIINEILQ